LVGAGGPVPKHGFLQGRDLQFVDAVAAVDVVAEVNDAVAGRPGRDVGEVDRDRIGICTGTLSPLLIVCSKRWRLQPGVSRRSQVTRSRTFCTRTQPDESKRISLLNRLCCGVSCM
jgi:hypothetical protein